MIWAGISLGSLFFLLLLVMFDPTNLTDVAEADRANYPAFADFMQLGTFTVVMIILSFMALYLAYFFLARHLYYGAMERSMEKVDVWLTVTFGLLVLRLVYFIIGLLSSSDFFMGGYLFGILPLFYTLYCLWVVKAFRCELEESGETVKLRQSRFTPGYTIHPI
jgi:hypothetical protein